MSGGAIQMDWFALFLHFVSMSLLAVGGAITTAPEMHRFTVDENHWITDAEFNASVAIAQAAPGPNVIFIAVLGWQIGVNTGLGLWGGFAGAMVAMVGIMLPSTTLTFVATRWLHHNKDRMAVQAFKAGLAPVVIALLLATAYLLVRGNGSPTDVPVLWVVSVICMVLAWKTKVHILLLLGVGAVFGALGVI